MDDDLVSNSSFDLYILSIFSYLKGVLEDMIALLSHNN